MAAYQEEGTETLELDPIVVRFVWRHAAYPTGWSTRRQQLLIEDFALAAEKEVSGHLARRSRRAVIVIVSVSWFRTWPSSWWVFCESASRDPSGSGLLLCNLSSKPPFRRSHL
jgi:hypothetical protein